LTDTTSAPGSVFAPGGTPKEIVARIHSEVAKALRESEMQRKIQELGADPGP